MFGALSTHAHDMYMMAKGELRGAVLSVKRSCFDKYPQHMILWKHKKK